MPVALRCLSEIMTSMDICGFEVMLLEEEKADLQATLSEQFESVMKVLAAIDALKAEATHESDKEMVMDKIKARPGGVKQFNERIIGALRKWLLKTTMDLLAEEHNAEDVGLLEGVVELESALRSAENAEERCTEWLRVAQKKFGSEDAKTLRAKNRIAAMIHGPV